MTSTDNNNEVENIMQEYYDWFGFSEKDLEYNRDGKRTRSQKMGGYAFNGCYGILVLIAGYFASIMAAGYMGNAVGIAVFIGALLLIVGSLFFMMRSEVQSVEGHPRIRIERSKEGGAYDNHFVAVGDIEMGTGMLKEQAAIKDKAKHRVYYRKGTFFEQIFTRSKFLFLSMEIISD